MLDDTDRRILTMLQQEIPIHPTPYRVVGDRLGVDEAEVIDRVKRLKHAGYIRRIGGIFERQKLGYQGTLVAAQVPPGRMTEVAEIVNEYPGVTHNYEREDTFNLWFTLIAPSEERLAEILDEIRTRTGLQEIVSLPARRTFKIAVHFKLSEEEDHAVG